MPQFQQLWKAEMGFVQRVCSPDRDQRAQIERLSDGLAKAAAREYAQAQNGMMRGGADPFGARTMPRAPQQLVQRQMMKALQGKLSPEQISRYRDECGKRSEYQKRVTVLNLVVRLDERLVLTAEQREKLVEELTRNYHAGWGQSLEVIQNNRQYLPSIPDQQILPILNPRQKTIWHGAQKLGHVVLGGMGFGQAAVVIDDDVFLVDEVEIEAEVEER
jgi:hypothetical protein